MSNPRRRHSILNLGVFTVGAFLCATQARSQDIELEPTYGSSSLTAGFLPNPFVKKVVAGGQIQTKLGGVAAWIAKAPDFKLYYQAGKFPLTIRVESAADTTLLINLPDGTWIADDDSGGTLNPLLRFSNAQSGRYDIYVGTFNQPFADATLIIAENRPADDKVVAASPAEKLVKKQKSPRAVQDTPAGIDFALVVDVPSGTTIKLESIPARGSTFAGLETITLPDDQNAKGTYHGKAAESDAQDATRAVKLQLRFMVNQAPEQLDLEYVLKQGQTRHVNGRALVNEWREILEKLPRP